MNRHKDTRGYLTRLYVGETSQLYINFCFRKTTNIFLLFRLERFLSLFLWTLLVARRLLLHPVNPTAEDHLLAVPGVGNSPTLSSMANGDSYSLALWGSRGMFKRMANLRNSSVDGDVWRFYYLGGVSMNSFTNNFIVNCKVSTGTPVSSWPQDGFHK